LDATQRYHGVADAGTIGGDGDRRPRSLPDSIWNRRLDSVDAAGQLEEVARDPVADQQLTCGELANAGVM